MVAGAVLVMAFTAIHDRRAGSAQRRWPLLLPLLGVGISAYGSAGLKRGDWGWWAFVLWAVLLAGGALVGAVIRTGRGRRRDLADPGK